MSLAARFRLAPSGPSRRLRARLEGDDRLTVRAAGELFIAEGRFRDGSALVEAARSLFDDPAVDAARSAVELRIAGLAAAPRSRPGS